MSDLQANLETVAQLRETLVGFVHRQQDALESVNDDIRWTLDKLDDARRHWQYRVDLYTRQAAECYERAAWAAAQGGWLDCSPYAKALGEAEEQLAEQIAAEDRFERAVEDYRVAHHRMADVLGLDVPRAVSYLDAILDGMEAYLAIRLWSTPVPTPERAHRSGELPLRPTEGPVTPPERREGNFGGPERRG